VGKPYNFTIRPRRETNNAVIEPLLVTRVGALGPVTTFLFGWFEMDETMSPVQLAGAALVLGGVVLVTLRPAR